MKSLKLLLVILISMFSSKSYSQYYYYNNNYYDNDFVFEFGASVGVMNCITDVGGANSETKYYLNEMRMRNHKFSPGFYFGTMYQNFIGARLEATYGSVSADDKDITNPASLNLVTKRNRNLHFRSNILELALLAEFHPLMIKYYEDGLPLISPYVAAGVGYFNFNPQALAGGRWVDLQPLRTEGQGFPEYRERTPYKRSGVNVPIGLGLRYEVSNMMNVRFEFLHRVLFTDYLDDASNRFYPNQQLFSEYLSPMNAAYAKALSNPSRNGKVPARRGNPDDNDSYMSFSLKVGIVLGRPPQY
jgi:hypothetical protein